MQKNRKSTITELQVKELYRKNNRCIYCGKKVVLGKHGVDYCLSNIFPKAVFKWTTGDLYKLKRPCNLAIAHVDCRENNAANVLSHTSIERLYTTKVHKLALHRFRDRIKAEISEYVHMLNIVVERQDFKCKHCGKKLKRYTSNLRRVNPDEPRHIYNAMALCNCCCNQLSRRSTNDERS